MTIEVTASGSPISVSASGTKIDATISGAQGPQGPQGVVGPAGPANTLSVGTVTGGETASATITGTAPSQTLNLVLPKGDQGEPGPQGPQGDKGDKGDAGEQGPQGVAGAAGAKGDKGDTGDTGPAGPAGAKGDKGDTGDTGPQGPSGAAGAKGDKGDTGDAGPQGPAGVVTATAPVTYNAGTQTVALSIGSGLSTSSGSLVLAAHKTSHATGGTDALTPPDIGAASAVHTHSALDIQSGTLDAARLPVATANAIGGVRIGSGISIDGSGVISASASYTLPNATTTTLGGVIVGTGLQVSSGTVSLSVNARQASDNFIHPFLLAGM